MALTNISFNDYIILNRSNNHLKLFSSIKINNKIHFNIFLQIYFSPINLDTTLQIKQHLSYAKRTS